MSFSFICHIIASVLVLIAVLLIFTNEAELAGLDVLEWAIFGFLFHTVGHWIPGSTH